MKSFDFILGGKWKGSSQKLHVLYPYNNSVVAQVSLASSYDIEKAIALASHSFAETKVLSSFERAEILEHIVQRVIERKEEFAQTITLESGKPLKDSKGEVARAITTLTLAKEEAKRINGEYLPVDITSLTKYKRAFVMKVPRGPVAAITPFNFPLNLVCHKIAPAIASGNSFVLKPASKTPLSSLLLGEIILETAWPKKAISVVPCHSRDAASLVVDERIKLLSFTGGADLGWQLKAKAGKKKVVLELGGNAAVILCADADVEKAVKKCTMGGFYYSGQNCIHVQRIYCHAKIFTTFLKKYTQAVRQLIVGDPMKETTDMSVMVDEENAHRVMRWIHEAVQKKAKVILGNKRKGNMVYPTLLTHVDEASSIACQEAFGPVVILEKFTDLDAVITKVNHSRFGLQAGIFTKDVGKIFKAVQEIDVGGLMINEIPTFRVDNMPYGGVKDSGFGREGVKYAIEDMMEQKVVVFDLT